MTEVAIIGVGMHRWGKFPEKSYVDLGVEATTAALRDAGMEWTEIQGLAAGCYMWVGLSGIHAGHQLAAILGET